MTKLPTLLTINEVAALLRVHRNTLNRWRRAGTGPPLLTLPNGGTRYDRDQLLRVLMPRPERWRYVKRRLPSSAKV